MRVIWSLLIVFASTSMAWAQSPADAEAEKPEAKAEGPVAAATWSMPEREAKKLAKFLGDYLQPGKKERRDVLAKFQKFVDSQVDGHSVMEDVATWQRLAAAQRAVGAKVAKKGKITEVKIKDHGFPGNIGTVTYYLYVPPGYDARRSYPCIVCLPDNKAWPDARKFIEEVWTSRSAAIRDGFIVVAPKPHTKGDRWSNPNSLARAMITLRHVLGTWDATKKNGGPAANPEQIFIDGEDLAAITAARYAELFAGVVLRKANGRDVGRTDLRQAGALNGLPAYCVYKNKAEHKFAQKIKAANDKTLMVETKDDKFLGEADEFAKWMASVIDSKDGVRTTQPHQIEYTVHESSFQRHYWINVLQFDASVKPAANFLAIADRAKNEVRVDVEGITRFELFLNDAIVDLNKPVKIVVVEDGKDLLFSNDAQVRSLGVLLEELADSNQPWRVYPVKLEIDVAALRAAHEAKEAAKAAEKKDDKGGTGADAAAKK
ncbi:MAG: hypothetical protein ACYTGN_18020 [Planctomycetota bacterium]|jgi:hypothetical protein